MNGEEVIQEIRERLIKIETMVELQLKDVDSRIKKVEDNQTWLWRTVIAGIITGAIAIYFKR